ncbi:hypothetical protein PIB30_045080 [Stylosanthes scabra]|uniref:Uncharacterized protein n=1 Tax=Stylosanthes scabra TaxID=79078 RepID=A0ABU6WEB1_9FABA|nr:hypothetical protein [Stylosanthes scabra]
MHRQVVHCVKDINARKLDWNLVVRVARMYRMPCQWKSSDAYSLELILRQGALHYMEQTDVEPLVIVAQLFKPHVIVNNCTRCLNLLLWNPEHSVIVGKSVTEVMDAGKNEKDRCYPEILEEIIEKKFLFKILVSGHNIFSGDHFYRVSKISDDEAMIELYYSQASLVEQGSLSNVLLVYVAVESGIDGNGGTVVSLSKDSGMESNFESLDTPAKGRRNVSSSKIASPEGQGSNSKTFRCNAGSESLIVVLILEDQFA